MDDDLPDQHINIQISDTCGQCPLESDQIKNIVSTISGLFNLCNVTISIVAVNNSQMQKLNTEFLKSEKITDVLSFDLSDNDDPLKCYEIIVNSELATQEAEKRNHTPQAELALYITHGLLHQLGYDDQDQGLAMEMHKKEAEILNQLGFDFIYNEQDFVKG